MLYAAAATLSPADASVMTVARLLPHLGVECGEVSFCESGHVHLKAHFRAANSQDFRQVLDLWARHLDQTCDQVFRTDFELVSHRVTCIPDES